MCWAMKLAASYCCWNNVVFLDNWSSFEGKAGLLWQCLSRSRRCCSYFLQNSLLICFCAIAVTCVGIPSTVHDLGLYPTLTIIEVASWLVFKHIALQAVEYLGKQSFLLDPVHKSKMKTTYTPKSYWVVHRSRMVVSLRSLNMNRVYNPIKKWTNWLLRWGQRRWVIAYEK